jgi:hypothetical protein
VAAWPLNNLAAPDGPAWGNTDSDRTQYSFTANVPFTIQQLLAEPFAIAVAADLDHQDDLIACANIGGITDQIGTLVIGIRPEQDLHLSGVAVLSPSASDPTRTLVSAFLTGAALGVFETDGIAPPTEDAQDVPVQPTTADPVATEPPVIITTEPPVVEPTPYPTADPTQDDDDGDDDEDEPDDDNSGHGGDDEDDSGSDDDNSGSGSDD